MEVGQLGYTAPEIPNGAQARYPVTYQAQDAYGYCVVLSGQQTQIVLNPAYAGFPLNDDPDGDVLGAMRITVAHELKHAIQRMYTPWSEGPWLELDATWVEDVVFDAVNDYVHFVRLPGSPFTSPQTSLIQGTGGSYEDCSWETYQSQTLGNDHLRRFWERRRVNRSEPVISTYERNFLTSGTTFDAAWGEYVAWNFASGEHAGPGFGYEEAASYPTTPASFIHETLPVPSTPWGVIGLGASTHLIPNPDATLGGTPEFTFAGVPGIPWQVSLLYRPRAGSVFRVPLSLVDGAVTFALPLDWAELDWAALVVGNPIQVGISAIYNFSARAIAPVAITHSRIWDVAEGTPIVVRAGILSGTEILDPASVALTYRVNGGATTTLPMVSSGADQYQTDIPFQFPGSTIEYRIDAAGQGGGTAGSPSIPGAFHHLQVVSVFEPFETAGTWTVGDSDDRATTGIWDRAKPVGTVAAPYVDASSPPGASCFVTQNGAPGGAASDADVDGGKTTLLSPTYTFDSGHAYDQVVARYRRWYSNDIAGRPDDAWRVDASNDDGATWTNVETEGAGDERWVPVTVDLLARFGQPDRVRFRFVAEDSGVASLVEAAVDDFEILAALANPVAVPGGGPGTLALGPASPNPSRARFMARLTAPHRIPARATVFDLAGRTVRRVIPNETWLPAGVSTIEWDGRTETGTEAPAGLYLLEVRAGGLAWVRRLVRLK